MTDDRDARAAELRRIIAEYDAKAARAWRISAWLWIAAAVLLVLSAVFAVWHP